VNKDIAGYPYLLSCILF